MVNRVRLLIMVAVLVPLLLLAAGILVYDSTPIASSPNVHYTSFSVGGKTFEFTYLATNQSALEKGLMGVKVTATTTELFVFPTAGYYSFWMYGVNSSLDIMWVYTLPGEQLRELRLPRPRRASLPRVRRLHLVPAHREGRLRD